MALNRYNHKFVQPLQVNEQVVNTSTVSSLNATNIANSVSLAEGLSITKEFTNNAEDFIIRPTSFVAWRGGISWTRSTGTSARGLRVATWDNNGSRNDWFSVWNGSVGIGSGLDVTTGQFVGPRGKLHVGEDLTGGNTDAAAYNFKQAGADSGSGFYLERVGERKGYYIFVDSSNVDSFTIRRNTDGTKANSFEISRTGDVTVREGNLVIGTSGKGIDFSAGANAVGMTSELLDDYEEGTFTPTISTSGVAATITYGSERAGRYIKIGKQVTVWITISTTARSSGSGNIQLDLPFQSTGSGSFFMAGSIGTVYQLPHTSTYAQFGVRVPAGTAVMNIWEFGTQGGSTTDSTLTIDKIPSAGSFFGTFAVTYYTT
jgi:hypothetical protein